MMQNAGKSSRVFPDTTLYNEGWLLRLTLDWFSCKNRNNDLIPFNDGAYWFSEALLPSRFIARHRGDRLSEGWTHADGVVGHFTIGRRGIADLSVDTDARQMLITEAKVFSNLSPGVANARYFDQAARNLACLAEVIRIAGIQPDLFTSLGFLVLAPKEQIDAGVFAQDMSKDSILDKVGRRVAEYDDPSYAEWFSDWFRPVLEKARVECLSWEEIIEHIKLVDLSFGDEIDGFYTQCLAFNRPSKRGDG